MNRRNWIGTVLLLALVLSMGIGLVAWKYESIQDSVTASAKYKNRKPMESYYRRRRARGGSSPDRHLYRNSSGLTLGHVEERTCRDIREVRLTPGQIVEAGTLLVALNVSVEEADLKAQEAQAALTKTVFNHQQNLMRNLLQLRRKSTGLAPTWILPRHRSPVPKAIIAKKTIRAPFRALSASPMFTRSMPGRRNLAYNAAGRERRHTRRFHSGARVAAGLRDGEIVEVFAAGETPAIRANVVALDARVVQRLGMPSCGRGLMVRALCWPPAHRPVRVPVGPLRKAVSFQSARYAKDQGRSGIRDRAGSKAEDTGACAVRRKQRDGR